jgi:capsule polysaccharide export protein KpsC/LpsZ
MVVSMSLGRAQKKNVKVIKRQVNFFEDTFEKAQKLAEMLTEGNVSMLVRKLIEEKYEELFGKKPQQGGG